MRSEIIQKPKIKIFKRGDILEYIPRKDDPEGIKIIVVFSKSQSSTFTGTCLHAHNAIGWEVGEVSTSIDPSAFKLFEGTLELSN